MLDPGGAEFPAVGAVRASIPATDNPRTRILGLLPHVDAQYPVAFEALDPKAWQLELFRPRHNVEPREHSGRLLDELRANPAPVVVLVQASQTAMQSAVSLHYDIVTIVSCLSWSHTTTVTASLPLD
jgi:hypothetical protein